MNPNFSALLCVHKDGNLTYEFNGMVSIQCSDYNSINENEQHLLSISPNPFSTEIEYLSKRDIASLEIYNTAGALIHSNEDLGLIGTMNLSKLSSGLYFAKFIFKDGEVSLIKITKK